MSNVISVFGSKVGDEELLRVKQSLSMQWMGIGPNVREFERLFGARLYPQEFAMLDSGSNSLYMAIKLLDLPPGSEVILPSFTWISCAHAVLLCNCVPVFCDVDLDTHNITAESIGRQLTERTRAIMVVHYAGKPVRMQPIIDMGLPVIEDAAHAVDSALCGRPCGTLADIGIYSFDAGKNLATPEGGGLTAKDPALVARTRTLRYCGIGKSGFEASANKDRWWEYEIVDVCPKFLPNDISAGIGLAQLARLPENQKRRQCIWNCYQKEFAGLNWLVRPQDAGAEERHSYFTYCIRVLGDQRDRLAKDLLGKQIYTTLRYHPLHLNPIYKSSAKLPVCEQLNEEALNLPMHPNLSDEDVERIVAAVRTFHI